jgi:TolA-binding protein
MKHAVLLLSVLLCFSAADGFCSGTKDIEKMKGDIARIEESLKLDQGQIALLRDLLDSLEIEIPDMESVSDDTLSQISEKLSRLQVRLDDLEGRLQAVQDQGTALPPENRLERSDRIMGSGSLRLGPAARFILSKNPNEKLEDITELLRIYMEIAGREQVNYDIAIAQMCFATDYLKQKDNNYNYAGFSPEETGRSTISFRNREEGILAHIQHLKAYASPTEIPRNQLVDPRYNILEKLGYRNSVETFDQLYAKWAPRNGVNYGKAITDILTELRQVSDGNR